MTICGLLHIFNRFNYFWLQNFIDKLVINHYSVTWQFHLRFKICKHGKGIVVWFSIPRLIINMFSGSNLHTTPDVDLKGTVLIMNKPVQTTGILPMARKPTRPWASSFQDDKSQKRRFSISTTNSPISRLPQIAWHNSASSSSSRYRRTVRTFHPATSNDIYNRPLLPISQGD